MIIYRAVQVLGAWLFVFLAPMSQCVTEHFGLQPGFEGCVLLEPPHSCSRVDRGNVADNGEALISADLHLRIIRQEGMLYLLPRYLLFAVYSQKYFLREANDDKPCYYLKNLSTLHCFQLVRI